MNSGGTFEFLTAWILSAATYIVLAGKASVEELVTAAICGFCAAICWQALDRVTDLPLRLSSAAIGRAADALVRLPAATGKVGLKLLQSVMMPVDGQVVMRELIHGQARHPHDAGRRAVAILSLSLAPGGFVLRLPEGRDLIELHMLTDETASGDARWPS